jgi:UDP-N-acetyl-D-mannosaminuronate dehydrogenase
MGTCIPIDPFYFAWKAKEYQVPARFIELAGEINLSMPRYVVNKLEQELDRRLSIPLGKARILVLGVAYKRNAADVRESPSFALRTLRERTAQRSSFTNPAGDAGARRVDRTRVGRAQHGNAARLRLRALGHRSRGARLPACSAPCAARHRYTQCLRPAGIDGNHIVKA